jgi:chemotaxis protein methyltransferase CheR
MTTGASASRVVADSSGAYPDTQLLRIRDLVYDVAGIFHPDHNLVRFEECCRGRMQQVGSASLAGYFDCLAVNPSCQAELVNLLNDITVGETQFFRNQAQADAIRRVVLPRIAAGKADLPVHHLRIWSAGCCTGEEPYSLAIQLLEASTDPGPLQGWDFEIFGTDINERALSRARVGVYSQLSARHVSPLLREKYFTVADHNLAVAALLKPKVTFSRLNLLDDSRMTFMKSMDVILCCNVLIYFDMLSRQRVLQHFYNCLLPQGYFFVGAAESLFGLTEDFTLVHFPGATGYIKAPRRGFTRQLS